MPPPAAVDPTAVAGRRIGAWFIDAIIYVIVFWILLFALGIGPTATRVPPDQVRSSLTGVPANHELTSDDVTNFCNDWNRDFGGWSDGLCLPNVAGAETERGSATIVEGFAGMGWLFLALVVAFIIAQGLLGGSLGKLIVGLRVVRADGSRAGIGASAIRTLLWIIDAITCGLPILGGILILTTNGHRRIGDMAAGTYVVPAAQVGHPVLLPGHPTTGNAATYPGGPYGATTGPGVPPPTPSPPNGPWVATGPDPTAGTPPSTPDHVDPTRADAGAAGYEADQPVWDDARHAYIQYDSERGEWLEFDESRQQWGPIST